MWDFFKNLAFPAIHQCQKRQVFEKQGGSMKKGKYYLYIEYHNDDGSVVADFLPFDSVEELFFRKIEADKNNNKTIALVETNFSLAVNPDPNPTETGDLSY